MNTPLTSLVEEVLTNPHLGKVPGLARTAGKKFVEAIPVAAGWQVAANLNNAVADNAPESPQVVVENLSLQGRNAQKSLDNFLSAMSSGGLGR